MCDNKFGSFELHNISSCERMDIGCVGYARNRAMILNHKTSYEFYIIVRSCTHSNTQRIPLTF